MNGARDHLPERGTDAGESEESASVSGSTGLSALEGSELAAPTEREALQRELEEALRRKRWATGWLMTVGFGPAAVIAVLLALFVEGSRDLAIGFAFLGAAMLALRAFRLDQRIKELERALEDPMDGS